MRVQAMSALREFWEKSYAPQGAREALQSWYKKVLKTSARNYAELRNQFPSIDKVGDCYVFDIMNNQIRLIAYVRYTDDKRSGLVFIRQVLTHEEYDKHTWPDDCGCYTPRPEKKTKAKKTKQKK